MAIHQPTHQPTIIRPNVARRVELFGAAIVALAVVLGLLLVGDRIGLSLWTTTQTPTNQLVISGTSGGGIAYTGIPQPASLSYQIPGAHGGGIIYTGIPYP